MANYYATIRTNYFAVTDEAKYREILESCQSEDEIHMFEDVSPDGTKRFGFGCYGLIDGIPTDENEEDLNAFYDALQSVLAEGDAIIITEIGSEKLRYLIGCCTVLTKRDIQHIDVCSKAVELAQAMLNDSSFTTQMDY